MKLRQVVLLAFFVVSTTLGSSCAKAWGDEGHKIIAAIAYALLTPAARERVDDLLLTDKDPLTPPDFSNRATWADKWRDSDRNGSKVRYYATRQWHFVNIELEDGDLEKACYHHPSLPAGTLASAGPAQDCLVHKIEQFIAELKNPSTDLAERLLAFKFVLHFVGDIHQPLHTADRHDRGGNEVPVLYGRRKTPDKLHAYWDTVLVARLGKDPLSVSATLRKGITQAKHLEWSIGTPAQWARESFAKARNVTYDFSGERFEDVNGSQAVVFDHIYDNRALPVVREQLSKAGVRLASVLNDALQ
jgi:hypothetical protein